MKTRKHYIQLAVKKYWKAGEKFDKNYFTRPQIAAKLDELFAATLVAYKKIVRLHWEKS